VQYLTGFRIDFVQRKKSLDSSALAQGADNVVGFWLLNDTLSVRRSRVGRSLVCEWIPGLWSTFVWGMKFAFLKRFRYHEGSQERTHRWRDVMYNAIIGARIHVRSVRRITKSHLYEFLGNLHLILSVFATPCDKDQQPAVGSVAVEALRRCPGPA
jgi:hypothetical protein